MTRTSFISTIATLTALVIGGIALRSWLEAHDERLQMQATLDAQKQLIVSAEQREQQRAAELKDTLAQIADLKRQVQTPQQIIRELPQYLPLPQPIQLASPQLTQRQSQAQRAADTPVQKGTDTEAEKGSSLPEGAKPRPAPNGANPSEGSGMNLPAPSGTNIPALNKANPPAANGSPSRGANAAAAVEFPVADLKPLYDFVQDCRACKVQLDAARADLSDERARSAALAKERDAAIKAAKGGSFWSRLGHDVKWLAIGTAAGFVLAHSR